MPAQEPLLPQPQPQPEIKECFDQLRQKHRLDTKPEPEAIPKKKTRCSKTLHPIMTSLRVAGHSWADIARMLDIDVDRMWSYIEKSGKQMKLNADALMKAAATGGAMPTTNMSFDDRIKVLSGIASNNKEDSATRISAIKLITDLQRDRRPEEKGDDMGIYRLVMEQMDKEPRKTQPDKVEPAPLLPPPPVLPSPPPTPDGRSGLDELKAHFKTPAPDGTELSFGFDIQEDTQDDQADKDTPA